MKVLLWTMALAFLFLIFSIFQHDHNNYQRTADYIKSVIDSSASGAVCYFDEAAYAEGYIRIKDDEALKYVDEVICQSLLINLEEKKLEHLTLEIMIFDDSSTIRKYVKEGRVVAEQLVLSLTGTDTFVSSSPYIYADGLSGKVVMVNAPGITVSVKAAGERYKLKFLPEPDIFGFSHYEVKGWE